MSQLDDFREQLRLAKGDDAASQEAAASEPAHVPSPQKTVRKKGKRSGNHPTRTAPAFPCPEEPSPAWTATVSGCAEMLGGTILLTALCWMPCWTRCWRPMKKPPLL